MNDIISVGDQGKVFPSPLPVRLIETRCAQESGQTL